ncbi:MAG: patatin-like phospholipase family protein [Firmicutes bacterium]|nr:patatin-like phospholipase family protein [Bacillota bacterium]
MAFWQNIFKKKTPVAEEADAPVKKRPKVALVLGGGGARGYGHVGAIRAFEEEGITFDFCVGTSVGSLIGALYAAGVTSEQMAAFSSTLELKDIHSGFLLRQGDPFKIGKVVTDIIGDVMIEDLKKPFYAVAVDLVEAKQVLFDKGSVALAVSASACVPGVFRPIVHGNQHLVDGGLLNNIPAETAKMLGADKVVTVDINPTRGSGTKGLGLIDIIKAMISIMGANSSQNGLRFTDVLVAPNLEKFSATKKDGYSEMIELGYAAAKEQAGNIKRLFEPEN